MSKSASTEDACRKKFQLTDSLLRRSLSFEDAEIIEVIEPAIVQCSQTKTLKGLGYKHAVVSAEYLYVVNTPAKSNNDLLMNLPLHRVVSIDLIYDSPDFLQGDFRDHAQHLKVEFQQYDSLSIRKQLLLQAESLSLLSFNRSQSVSSDPSLSWENIERNLNNSKSSEYAVKTLMKQNSKSQPKKRRPLPKPVLGTERLNASYTNALELKESHRRSLPVADISLKVNKSISPSRSMDNLLLRRELSPKIKAKNLNSSYPLNQPSNQSLNDSQSVDHYTSLKRDTLSDTQPSDHASVSLSQSVASRLFQLFKGSNNNGHDENKEFLSSSYIHSLVSSRSASIQSVNSTQGNDFTNGSDLYDMHIYTLSKNSKLYNALREAWVQSLLKATQNKSKSISRMKSVSRKSSLPVERDNMLNKFSQLREEVLQCRQDDELFLLTKEINFACQKYFAIKKLIWKSTNLVKFYLKKIIALCQSQSDTLAERLDEIDLLILITEFIVHLLEGTELVFYRNALINEYCKSLLTNVMECILQSFDIDHLVSTGLQDQQQLFIEIDELTDAWNEMRIFFLVEIASAGEQFNWCFTSEIKKSFDTSFIVDVFQNNEQHLLLLIEHIMGKVVYEVTNDYERVLTGENYVSFYKYLVFLDFVFVHMSDTANKIRIQYQEEVKYYLSKAGVMETFPRQYPLSVLATPLLEKLLKDLKP